MASKTATAEAPPRVLPHNLEAERAVLGAILINNDVFHAAAAIVQPKDFFRDAHRRIYKAIWKLADDDSIIDLVTVKALMEQSNDLDEAGGASYLASLIDGVPYSTNVIAYSEIVKDASTLRSMITTGNKIVTRAYEADESAKQIVTWAEQQMFDLAHGHLTSKLTDLRAGTRALLDDLDFRIKNKGQVTGIDTGFDSLNQLTLGWQRGDLIFVGARPSIGKTTFVMNSVTKAAQMGKRIAVFSMEMRRKQLEYRILSSLSDVELTRIMNGAIVGGDHAKISNAMEIMHELPLFIDDTPARTIWDIRSAARQMKADQGIDAVVVDYVQLMRGTLDNRNANRNMELTDISNRFKALAGELDVPIIVLSQLARKSLDRPDPRPKMSDLKDCGAFEQDADVVVLLHRKNHREGGVTQAIFEKQRNGPTGTANLTLTRETVTFTDGGEEPPEAPKPERVTPPGRRRRS